VAGGLRRFRGLGTWSLLGRDMHAYLVRVIRRYVQTVEGSHRVSNVALRALEDISRKGDIEITERFVQLDAKLQIRILENASPRELGHILWSAVGFDLRPQVFRALFKKTLARAKRDERAIHRLCGAACDYLRLHPGSFKIPRDIAPGLLNSANPHRRVIGLKAVRYSGISPREQLKIILSRARCRSAMERVGVFHQLGMWLDDWGHTRLTNSARKSVEELLRAIVERERDECARTNAENCLRRLEGLA
jgi:hypothetical protein